MFDGNCLGGVEIRDGAGNFQGCDRAFRGKARATSISRVQSPELSRAHCWRDHPYGYAHIIVIGARLLDCANPFHAGENLGWSLAGSLSPELLIQHGWHFDVDIDAIEQGTADLAEVVP
jgi:hypothetical protein